MLVALPLAGLVVSTVRDSEDGDEDEDEYMTAVDDSKDEDEGDGAEERGEELSTLAGCLYAG